jgi:hypothetical protein
MLRRVACQIGSLSAPLEEQDNSPNWSPLLLGPEISPKPDTDYRVLKNILKKFITGFAMGVLAVCPSAARREIGMVQIRVNIASAGPSPAKLATHS